ncbi:hypothetical protein RTE98_10840 [Stutzerimonas frequens]|uniref:hypothetical protein n=1 Tax=Stutzerimonas frequens TaxID=2968969 RepID=UPI002934B297|nr:hypothetical protein [Stutzerimonas frequens]WOC76988.1 hypothetical protein RTE98_10840 [Stutzerimonas frequens]
MENGGREELQEDKKPEIVDVRLELIFQRIKTKFGWSKYHRSVTQGNPVTVFVRATNISKTICKGFCLQTGKFKPFQYPIMEDTINQDIQFPALNPGEERIIKLEDTTFSTEGTHWFSCNIIPEPGQEIVTYQYDYYHGKDNKFAHTNQWGNDLFVVGQHAALQLKTNLYILILTVITVLEAVFGIKELLSFLLGGIGLFFISLGKFFSFISGFK